AALRVVDLDLLEEPEVLDTLLRAPDFRGVESVALDQAEFAPDHVIERALVTDDVDPLDEDARALLDIESHVDRVSIAVAVYPRLDVDEGIPPVAERIGESGDRLLDLVGIVPVAIGNRDERRQLAGLELLDLAFDI